MPQQARYILKIPNFSRKINQPMPVFNDQLGSRMPKMQRRRLFAIVQKVKISRKNSQKRLDLRPYSREGSQSVNGRAFSKASERLTYVVNYHD